MYNFRFKLCSSQSYFLFCQFTLRLSSNVLISVYKDNDSGKKMSNYNFSNGWYSRILIKLVANNCNKLPFFKQCFREKTHNLGCFHWFSYFFHVMKKEDLAYFFMKKAVYENGFSKQSIDRTSHLTTFKMATEWHLPFKFKWSIS